MKKYWLSRTQIGTFYIYPQLEGRFALYIESDFLSTYQTPNAAADAVYYQNTGYTLWDSLERPMPLPADISDWYERVEPVA